MTTINPGQLMVKANNNGGVDVTIKSSSGHSKSSSAFNNLASLSNDDLEALLAKGYSSTHSGSGAFSDADKDLIRKIAKGQSADSAPIIDQVNKADTDAYYPTETSHLDQSTGVITDNGKVVGQTSPSLDPDTGLPRAPNPDINVPAPTAQTTVLLKQGTGTKEAPDASVLAVQKQLGISADGIFGPQTKSAVMAFQQQNGLQVDGIVGPQTLAALQKTKSGGTTSTSAPGQVLGASDTTTTKAPDDPTNQFNTATGVPNPKYINPATGMTTQQEIENINTTANDDQDKLLASLTASLGSNVDVSNSSKLLTSMIESLEDVEKQNPAENTPSLAEQLAKKRTELGVDPLEKNLNDIDAQIAKLDADNTALQQTDENRVESLSQINRRKSADQINYEKNKNDLTLQRNSIANELNTKYSVINTFMQYTQQDYQNAAANYDTKYKQAIDMINLTKGVIDEQKSDLEKSQDTAKANLQLMSEALAGKDYTKLDPATKANITKLESQAGLPAGFMQYVIQASDKPVVSMGSEYTDASGNRSIPVYTQDPGTGLISAKVITVGKASTSNNSSTLSTAEKKTIGAKILKTGLGTDGAKLGNPQGTDGFADPGVYLALWEAWDGTTQDFLTAFNPIKYVNPLSYKLLPESIRPVAKKTTSSSDTSADDDNIF